MYIFQGPSRNPDLDKAWPTLISQLPKGMHDLAGAKALQALGYAANKLASADAANDEPPTTQTLFVKQAGVAIMLGAVDVHPMQPLETAYQGIVRRAGDAAPDPDQQRARQQAALDRFFRFAIIRLSTMPPTPSDDADPPLLSDKLWLGKRYLKMASRYVKALYAKPGVMPSAESIRQVTSITQLSQSVGTSALREFESIKTQLGLERLLDGSLPDIGLIAAAERDLNAAERYITNISRDPRLFAQARTLLESAYENLDIAADGLASVQALFFIDTFYLYRLLVRFRLESPVQLSDEDQRIISDKLTGLLHTKANAAQHSWIADYFAWAMADLGQAVRQAAPNKAIFFLKGGRAVEYLLGSPANGKNDWDTQIVIDPGLPAQEWYDVFDTVHNVIIERLEIYRRGFLYEMNANASALIGTIDDALDSIDAHDATETDEPEVRQSEQDALQHADDGLDAAEADDQNPDPPVLARYSRSCKAELIDVGMPRRDTVECYEQWRLLHDNILVTDGVCYPDHLYFANDFIFMMREVVAGGSRSAAKAKKRLNRLGRVLANAQLPIWDMDTLRQLTALCPQSTRMLGLMVTPEVANLGWVALEQFAVAYDLRMEAAAGERPTLATIFDGRFAATFSGSRRPPDWPASLQQTYDNLDNPTDKSLFYAIGSMNAISNDMEQALSDRAQALDIMNPDSPVMGLVHQLTAEPLFQRESRNELRLGVAAALAAGLQERDAADGGQPPEQTEPVIRADLRVYSATSLNAGGIVMDVVEDVLKNIDISPQFEVVPRLTEDQNWIAIRLSHPVSIKGISYVPTVLVIAAEPQEGGWPLLNTIEDVPVISPRDLVLEYRRRMGHVDEYGARRRLRSSEQAVISIMTNYEAPPQPHDQRRLV